MAQERLQKILAQREIASRRKAEELIAAGKVKVNGHVAKLGDKADPRTDVITVRGKRIGMAEAPVYLMLNKPRGYITTMDDEKDRKCVAQLVEKVGARVFPVGRLDKDSEGLLLLTNDGDFANSLMHPKHEVEKTYEVWAAGYTTGAEERLKLPITLDGYRIKPPKVKLLNATGDQAHLLVTIHEGRNRQVRRMCDAVGMYVTRLRRIREGSLSLGELPKGKWRYLTADEIAKLK